MFPCPDTHSIRSSSQHLLELKASINNTHSFPKRLFLSSVGAQGCCGVEQSCGCFTPRHMPGAVRGPGATHPPLPPCCGLGHPLQSLPATSIEEQESGLPASSCLGRHGKGCVCLVQALPIQKPLEFKKKLNQIKSSQSTQATGIQLSLLTTLGFVKIKRGK